MPRRPVPTPPVEPRNDEINQPAKPLAEAVFVLDRQGVVRFYNQPAAELLGPDAAGLDSVEFARRLNLRTINGANVAAEQLPGRQVLTGMMVQDRAFRFTGRDGQDRIALITASPLIVHNGQASSAVLTMREITGQDLPINGGAAPLGEAGRDEALDPSRQRIIEILEGIEDGFFAIDHQWRFTYVNERAAKTANLNKEELIGQVIWEKWPQLLGTEFEQNYRRVMVERVPVNFEFEGLLTGAWHLVQVYPTNEGISVFWIDITERKELEQRLVHHSLLLETIHDAVMATDVDGRITTWNRAAEELSGWSAAEVLGKKIGEVIQKAGQSAADDEATWLPLQEGKPVVLEVPLYRKDGRRILVATTTMPILGPKGELIGYVSAGRNITEQKMAEEALQKAFDELEARVQERTKELTELQWRLIESLEAERLRVSRELHDGPMQELYGLMYQVSLLANSNSEAKFREDLGALEERLQEVGESLRAIAYNLRPVSLTQLGLEKAIREYTARLHQEFPRLRINLALDPDEDRLPESQRLALFRVCQVAMINVMRHANANRVDIRLSCGEERAVLEIQDDGQGFEVPNNLLSLARKGHLGLVGAAERVEALGGYLEVYSQIGKGTRLLASIPAS